MEPTTTTESTTTPAERPATAKAAPGGAAAAVSGDDNTVTVTVVNNYNAAPVRGRGRSRPKPQREETRPAPSAALLPPSPLDDVTMVDPITIRSSRREREPDLDRILRRTYPELGNIRLDYSHHPIALTNPVTGRTTRFTGTVDDIRGGDGLTIKDTLVAQVGPGSAHNRIEQTERNDVTFLQGALGTRVFQDGGNDVFAERGGYRNIVFQSAGNDTAFVRDTRELELDQGSGSDTAYVIDAGPLARLNTNPFDKANRLNGGAGSDRLVIQLAPGERSLQYKVDARTGHIIFDLGDGRRYDTSGYERFEIQMAPGTVPTLHSERGDTRPRPGVTYTNAELFSQGSGNGEVTLQADLPRVTRGGPRGGIE